MLIYVFPFAVASLPFLIASALGIWNRAAAHHRRRRMPVAPMLALLAQIAGCGPQVVSPTDAGADAPSDAPMSCEPQTGNCTGDGCVDSLIADPNCGSCGLNCAARGAQCGVVAPDIFGCVPVPCTVKGDMCSAGACVGTCDGYVCVPACSDGG